MGELKDEVAVAEPVMAATTTPLFGKVKVPRGLVKLPPTVTATVPFATATALRPYTAVEPSTGGVCIAL